MKTKRESHYNLLSPTLCMLNTTATTQPHNYITTLLQKRNIKTKNDAAAAAAKTSK